jgi:hypothetical protein
MYIIVFYLLSTTNCTREYHTRVARFSKGTRSLTQLERIFVNMIPRSVRRRIRYRIHDFYHDQASLEVSSQPSHPFTHGSHNYIQQAFLHPTTVIVIVTINSNRVVWRSCNRQKVGHLPAVPADLKRVPTCVLLWNEDEDVDAYNRWRGQDSFTNSVVFCFYY